MPDGDNAAFSITGELRSAQMPRPSTPWGERRSGDYRSRAGDQRPVDEKDRSRIIHSATFRRLQGKTQVLGITEGDFHRTRLTHSMEVAQIARGLVLQIHSTLPGRPELHRALPSVEQIETIAFAHDLGHPPFGHGGEVALNYVMRDNGGFEGNGHSLRLLSRLEQHNPGWGIDATRRTLLGILKYPVQYDRVVRKAPPLHRIPQGYVPNDLWKPPKCYLETENDVVEWILRPLSSEDRRHFVALLKRPTATSHGKSKYQSLDTSIMDVADEIAYGVHDLEDGIALGLLRMEHWRAAEGAFDHSWGRRFGISFKELTRQLFPTNPYPSYRKQAISSMVNAFVGSVRVKKDDTFEEILLAHNVSLRDEAEAFRIAIHQIKFERIIEKQEVQTLEHRGRAIATRLFEAIQSDARLLAPSFRWQWEQDGNLQRAACDYVAGMTDAYASRLYERLFIPRAGSVFEKL